mgnify:CR=1 FL=1
MFEIAGGIVIAYIICIIAHVIINILIARDGG